MTRKKFDDSLTTPLLSLETFAVAGRMSEAKLRFTKNDL